MSILIFSPFANFGNQSLYPKLEIRTPTHHNWFFSQDCVSIREKTYRKKRIFFKAGRHLFLAANWMAGKSIQSYDSIAWHKYFVKNLIASQACLKEGWGRGGARPGFGPVLTAPPPDFRPRPLLLAPPRFSDLETCLLQVLCGCSIRWKQRSPISFLVRYLIYEVSIRVSKSGGLNFKILKCQGAKMWKMRLILII